MGLSDARIVEAIHGLTPADLTMAWDYQARNSTEIDEEIRRNREA